MHRILVFLATLTVFHPAMAQQNYQPLLKYSYLSQAAEKLMEASQKSDTLTIGQFQEVMAVACSALTRLSEDKEFYSRIKDARRNDKEISGVLADISALSEFMQIEGNILVSMGVSKATARQMTSDLILLKEQVSKSRWDDKTIESDLASARKAVCDAKNQSIRRHEISVLVLKSAKLTAGTVFIVGNLMASGLTAGVSGASVALGVTIVSQAL